jgi:hypothetical protein
MSDETKQLQGILVRKYLGKRGIHAISVDEAGHTVNVFVDKAAAADPAVTKIRKDAGKLEVKTIESPRAHLV